MARAQPDRLYDLIRLVRPLYRTLSSAVESKLEGSGVTVAMRAVLEQLHDHGPRTVPEVAEAMGTGRQFVQRTVDELRARGLVDRTENPAHRRSWLVRPTRDGERVIRRILRREGVVLERVSAGLDARELETCRRVVERIIEAFAEES